MHDYDPKRYDLIEGVSKCMISRQEAQAKFNEYQEAQGSHDEVYTDGSKMDQRVGAAAVINRHFQNGETTCCQLSKRLPDNSTIFAAEATAISLALNYYQLMGPVHHDTVIYSDSMSCLQAIEGEDTENPFIIRPFEKRDVLCRGNVRPSVRPSDRPSAFSGLFFNMLWDINLKLDIYIQ